MIVIGLDVHKHSLTAVAVDELGRERGAWSGPIGLSAVQWAQSLEAERLWAVEDCRHVTRALEQTLLAAGERLVRVPPRLTAPQRRRGRARGKSDRIDALAVARAALQEPQLDGPRAGEETLRELKLLVDHRDDLVAERRRCQQRLRWHLHELDPNLCIPLGALDRTVWLDRLARQLARREQTTQARIARDLLVRCRALTRSIADLDRDLDARTTAIAPRLLALPGCGPLSAAKAALPDRPDRTLPHRRPARSPRRRRTARRQLRQTPPRPQRQPTTQLRAAPDRRHPGTRPRTRARQSRAETEGRQKPP
jgi:transposase